MLFSVVCRRRSEKTAPLLPSYSFLLCIHAVLCLLPFFSRALFSRSQLGSSSFTNWEKSYDVMQKKYKTLYNYKQANELNSGRFSELCNACENHLWEWFVCCSEFAHFGYINDFKCCAFATVAAVKCACENHKQDALIRYLWMSSLEVFHSKWKYWTFSCDAEWRIYARAFWLIIDLTRAFVTQHRKDHKKSAIIIAVCGLTRCCVRETYLMTLPSSLSPNINSRRCRKLAQAASNDSSNLIEAF